MLPEVVYRPVQQGADDAVEVSFMVPCLNEEENVVGTIETIMSALTRVGCSYEILVFDDGSQDNTAGVVTAFQAAQPQARKTLAHYRARPHPTPSRERSMARRHSSAAGCSTTSLSEFFSA